MNREKVSENVKRRLYAESMGRCMNPNCREDFFSIEYGVFKKDKFVIFKFKIKV